MGIIRVKKNDSQYIQIHKYPIYDDDSLSWKAKGLLTYLVGHPKDWQTRVNDLVQHGTDGEKSVRSGLKELRDQGYAKMYPERDPQGKIVDWNWEIYELPLLRKEFILPDAYFGDLDIIEPDCQNGDLDMIHPDAQNGDLENMNLEALQNQASYPDACFLHVENGDITKIDSCNKDLFLLDPRSEKPEIQTRQQADDLIPDYSSIVQEIPGHPERGKSSKKNITKIIALPTDQEVARRQELLRQAQQLKGA